MHWVFQPFRRALEYSGRSRRREYWLFLLTAFVFILLYGEVAPGGSISADIGTDGSPIDLSAGQLSPQQSGIWGIVSVIMGLAILIPGVAVTVRRLHDIDRTGLWIVLPVAPVIFWAIAISGGFNSEGLFRLVLPAILIAPVGFLVMMGWEGNRGSNRFGSDPKGTEDARLDQLTPEV